MMTTFYHDKLPTDSIAHKLQKYNLVLAKLRTLGWQVKPLIILTHGQRGHPYPQYNPLLASNCPRHLNGQIILNLHPILNIHHP